MELIMEIGNTNFLKLFFGEKTDDFVLFVDRLGTTSSIRHADADGIEQRILALEQTHFINILARLAKIFSDLKVYQVSDCAFIYGADLPHITTFALALFKHMTITDDQKFCLYPLRGAIGKGLFRFDEDKKEMSEVKNLFYSPEIGMGNIDAYNLEQTGPKGMRLFISDNAYDPKKITIKVKHHSCMNFYELNWMSKDSITGAYLQFKLEGSAIKDHLLKVSNEYEKSGKDCYKNLSRSIKELVNWELA